MLYMPVICFTEIASADVSFREYPKICYPDGLYVNTTYTLGIISRNWTDIYKNATYITPLHPDKKEQGTSSSLVINTAANLPEENSLRKRPKKRHLFVTGKDDAISNPNLKNTKTLRVKIPP